MKKFILFVLILALAFTSYLTLQSVKPLNKLSSNTTTTLSNETTLDTTTTAITTESVTETTTVAPTVATLFGEKVIGQSDYPTAAIPSRLDGMDIYPAINQYYQENYSHDEKAANQQEVSANDIQELQDILNANEQLSSLHLTVDQVTMELDNQTVYIPRIIVPMTYTDAQQTLPDNDVTILTESMTQLGNRLIMIAYYDTNANTLTVYHLTNWTTPLFTYSDQ
ncbi:hypothetical protein JDW15_07605 [Aerococcaceae bacterium zg-ZJ1578]|uniref:hypothetical protein n=1 Tax=Aerococcaceae bacterium zg-252 TaxID=2796928 RepID=UPI001A2B4F96|nr:hypothetical protein [Aerococcaceae bacterium zg-1578]